MKDKLRKVWNELLIPDSHDDNWYAWGTNQPAHALLIGFSSGWVGLMLGFGPILSPLLVAAAYYTIWERTIQKHGRCSDQVMDTVHVMAGASLIAAASIHIAWVGPTFLIWLALLAYGILKRVD